MEGTSLCSRGQQALLGLPQPSVGRTLCVPHRVAGVPEASGGLGGQVGEGRHHDLLASSVPAWAVVRSVLPVVEDEVAGSGLQGVGGSKGPSQGTGSGSRGRSGHMLVEAEAVLRGYVGDQGGRVVIAHLVLAWKQESTSYRHLDDYQNGHICS